MIIGAFTDGRLLIVVTKFDENYRDLDEDETDKSFVTPESVANHVSSGVQKATGVKIDPNIVIPVSARWFTFSKNLHNCLLEMTATSGPEKIREFQKKRSKVECSLRDYPDLDIEGGQGFDVGRALTELPAAVLVEKLSGASRIPLLKQRCVCVHYSVCVYSMVAIINH